MSNTLSESLFTISINHKADGFLTLGYISVSYEASDIEYAGVVSSQSWDVLVTGWSFRLADDWYPGPIYTTSQQRALIDSGRETLRLPKDIVDKYFSRLAGDGNTWTSRTYPDGITRYFFDCSIQLPTLLIHIGSYEAAIPDALLRQDRAPITNTSVDSDCKYKSRHPPLLYFLRSPNRLRSSHRTLCRVKLSCRV